MNNKPYLMNNKSQKPLNKTWMVYAKGVISPSQNVSSRNNNNSSVSAHLSKHYTHIAPSSEWPSASQ